MKAIRHMLENPFIAGAGIAALTHSTWSLGTLFSGLMPVVSIEHPVSIAHWLYWFIPAFLIAFAMDIGQIDTSRKIRHEGLTWQRGVTFFVFAITTYYLQFLYIAHHMPALQIEAGISNLWRVAVTELRNVAIWLLPAILPLATLLYTLSDDKQVKNEPMHDTYQDIVTDHHEIVVTDINQDMAEWLLDYQDGWTKICENCGWESDAKNTERSAEMALRAHRLHCSAKIEDIDRYRDRKEGLNIRLKHPLEQSE